MALDFETAIDSVADLNLWYKIANNEPLTLADVPEIIRLRWGYFKDNWETIRPNYSDIIEFYSDPDQLKAQIDSFSEFVEAQRSANSVRNPFDTGNILLRFYSIFDNTLISGISITYEEQQIIDNKVNRVTLFTRGDFLAIRDLVDKERDAIADKASSTDTDYNRVFDRSPQIARINLGNKDINKMFELQETIKSINFVLANAFSLSTATVDPFALARQNANNPDIDISDYSSGSLTKINYGEDLQGLAARTLGAADRWIDIAIANGLKPPYIDEVGTKVSLISNASGNQINIAGLNADGELNIDKISVGQLVLLKSDVETFPEQRSVLNITEIPISGELILELEGEPDLSKYKLVDNAHIRIFKQNTINSSFYVLIPNTEELDDNRPSDVPWFLQSSDITERRQKVDFNLDDNGDINFDGTSDIQLSYGLENAVQAVKLKLMTEAGELRRHPEFGLVPLAGSANLAPNDVKNALITSITKNIAADERFSRIDRLDVGYSNILNANSGVALNVTLVVALAGSGQLVPITFSVNT